ncbi:hypothetical protein RRG08_052868 [Elysia crispata]|uniref:Uncharacterized protein n=1 Tax=Elysia crispata TaxID=231223 RepID=A0AAE0Z3W4_9GAST|nr:hypothetical protein RRG08_052868 [Elysia crispata]
MEVPDSRSAGKLQSVYFANGSDVIGERVLFLVLRCLIRLLRCSSISRQHTKRGIRDFSWTGWDLSNKTWIHGPAGGYISPRAACSVNLVKR